MRAKIINANPRKYGREPFLAVVVHGGPGAPGDLATLAEELAPTIGV